MKKTLFVAAAVILTAAILFSGYQLWRYYSAEKEVAEQFGDLSEQIQTPTPPPIAERPNEAEQSPEWTVSDQYGTLFEQNPDMIGWIKIDGTTIDYPVMQSPDRPRCKALSFYDTGVTAAYGNKLLTLSTCEYSAQGNRLVVVAKRID